MLMKILKYIVDFIFTYLIVGNLMVVGCTVGIAHVMGLIENEKDLIMMALLGMLIYTVELPFQIIIKLLKCKLTKAMVLK